MIAYLAAPIDFTDTPSQANEAIIDLKHQAREHLQACGYWVFDPAHAWKNAANNVDGTVQQINMRVISQCDVLVAVLVRGVLSIGTVLEIAHARQLDKKVFVIGDIGNYSIALTYLGVTVHPNIYEVRELHQ